MVAFGRTAPVTIRAQKTSTVWPSAAARSRTATYTSAGSEIVTKSGKCRRFMFFSSLSKVLVVDAVSEPASGFGVLVQVAVARLWTTLF